VLRIAELVAGDYERGEIATREMKSTDDKQPDE
jgi:hypothetical protein